MFQLCTRTSTCCLLNYQPLLNLLETVDIQHVDAKSDIEVRRFSGDVRLSSPSSSRMCAKERLACRDFSIGCRRVFGHADR